MEQGKPQLTISLLASNKTEAIQKCLDSLMPVTGQLDCELIIVDTSKNPEVGELLREYTGQVIPFSWCNDFSKARNVGLAQAKGEWFLYIDDDEWFEDTTELVRFFTSGEYRQYGYANYIQRNYLDPEYGNYSDAWVSRMIRLTPETRFRSRIHEYLYPALGKGKNLSLIANHTGYIHVTEADRRRRFERNATLLKEMIGEEPENLRWQMQLAQEYYAIGDWEHLSSFCKKALDGQKETTDAADCRGLATFYAGAAEGLYGLRLYEEAEQFINEAVSDVRLSPLGRAYLYLVLAGARLHGGKWDAADDAARSYLRLKEEITAEEEQYVLWQEALIADGAFDTIMLKKAYSIQIACGLAQGNTEALMELFDRLEWDKKAVYAYPALLPVLVEALLTMPEDAFFLRVWSCIWNNRSLYELAVKELRAAWQEEKKVRMADIYQGYARNILGEYYQEITVFLYPELLPEQAQRVLNFGEEIRQEE